MSETFHATFQGVALDEYDTSRHEPCGCTHTHHSETGGARSGAVDEEVLGAGAGVDARSLFGAASEQTRKNWEREKEEPAGSVGRPKKVWEEQMVRFSAATATPPPRSCSTKLQSESCDRPRVPEGAGL